MQLEATFYNTIHLKGYKLEKAIAKVKKQNARIYEIMKATKAKMTPFEVQEIYEAIWKKAPITLIRRGLTELTDQDKLNKLDEMRDGVYGISNHVWQIKTELI